MAAPQFAGDRRFTWFKPAGRRPTQYESYTVGQFSDPDQWLRVGWPLRFSDGKAPWTLESTALRCAKWSEYRDPAQTWQRPYISQHNQQEQAIAALVPEALQDGLAESIAPAWLHRVLGTYYAAWPFVEYGEFLCLCYTVRVALSDSLMFSIAFQVADKLRHSQDIVHYLLALQEHVPGFTDAAAREAWMTDPVLVPLREMIERIYSLSDWAEILVAINLALEPIVGELVKTEFLAKLAPLNGDPVTPMILAGVRGDTRRHLACTKTLVQLVTADSSHGNANGKIVREWIDKWTAHADNAARAMGSLFELPDIESVPFAPQFERVVKKQQAILRELGLHAGGRS